MYEILFIRDTKLVGINNLRKEDLFWFTTSEGSTHYDSESADRDN